MSLVRWVESNAVGFGPVGFMVFGTGQWMSDAKTIIRAVPGGTAVWTQFMGRGPEMVQYDAQFDSVADFTIFKTLIGTTNTLIVRADTAALSSTRPVALGGVGYDQIDDVLLAGIDPGSVQYIGNGITRCKLTFVRTVSDAPGTRADVFLPPVGFDESQARVDSAPGQPAVIVSLVRVVPSSVVASTTRSRLVASAVVVAVPPSLTVIVPSAVRVAATTQRAIPTTVRVAATRTRVLPSAVFVQIGGTLTKLIPSNVRVAATLNRPIPSAVNASRAVTRSIPSAVLSSINQVVTIGGDHVVDSAARSVRA